MAPKLSNNIYKSINTSTSKKLQRSKGQKNVLYKLRI